MFVCLCHRYCPKCQQHREASKQLLLWRLPNVLIIQLKRFSFRSFIWRDKINDMVDFPVRYPSHNHRTLYLYRTVLFCQPPLVKRAWWKI